MFELMAGCMISLPSRTTHLTWLRSIQSHAFFELLRPSLPRSTYNEAAHLSEVSHENGIEILKLLCLCALALEAYSASE